MTESGPLVTVRVHIRVSGLVQGVGFRPFVWREATARGLSGWVFNDAAGVVLEAEGSRAALTSMLDALRRPPPLARVDSVVVHDVPNVGGTGFAVRASPDGGPRHALVPADTATCDDCLRELRDPADRRHGYPFVNCTNCGPRFTIVVSVPYDRARTTMAPFSMCPLCRAEYDDPLDRRFHAEPVCCPGCGPTLRLLDASGAEQPGDTVANTVTLLRAGRVIAVKGLGGYHLAVDALDERAVARLRGRKHREDRPFAVMVTDVTAARSVCEVGEHEHRLLTGADRPIVVLRRLDGGPLAPSVAPGSSTVGVMLPYTPMHVLLLDAFGGPLVMTSGNASDEPIAFADDDAVVRLARLADAFLTHDRAIRTRVDDSLTRVVRDRVVPMRRSRGQVPRPLLLTHEATEPILACGAALKNTFSIARGRQVFVSQHIGDLGDYSTFRSFQDGIEHLTALLDVRPRLVAHDLHPDYPSTRYAQELAGVRLVGVQHHHAHIASCLVDNGVTDRVIGVAFDGLGLGTDGTAWGGEFLVADLAGFVRAAHLSPVSMPGGDTATRQPWRMALAHLDAAYTGDPPAGLAVAARQSRRWDQVRSAMRAGVNSPATTSAGRLFDAVSALLGIRDVVTYEGQAAVELEHAADPHETGSYPMSISGGAPAVVGVDGLVRAVTEDLLTGSGVAVVAARFHNALAEAVLDVCRRLREEHSLETVALSGGVWQNALLLGRCLDLLEGNGFRVLTHRDVPCNDGGVSLGQAAVAATGLRS